MLWLYLKLLSAFDIRLPLFWKQQFARFILMVEVWRVVFALKCKNNPSFYIVNVRDLRLQTENFSMMVIANAFPAVDTFFFLR